MYTYREIFATLPLNCLLGYIFAVGKTVKWEQEILFFNGKGWWWKYFNIKKFPDLWSKIFPIYGTLVTSNWIHVYILQEKDSL